MINIRVLNEVKANAAKCIDCGACYKVCPMMNKYTTSTKSLIELMARDTPESHQVAYSCMLCNACTQHCPIDIDLKTMFHNIRKDLYQQGKDKLPKEINKGIKRVEFHQKFSFSPIFSSLKQAKSLFIPGCSLTNYSPSIISSTLDYLKEHMEDVDLMVTCCGKPSIHIGDETSFNKYIGKIQGHIDKNQVEQIVVACENCYNTYKHHLSRVKVITLWEIIKEVGLPKNLINHYKSDHSYALHDPCSIKEEAQIHHAVREILNEIGIDFIEFEKNRAETKCCGSGGMVRETDRELWESQRHKRANETEAETIISYCQGCVNSLSTSHKNTLHILDLLFNESCISGNMMTQEDKSFAKAWLNKYKSAHFSD